MYRLFFYLILLFTILLQAQSKIQKISLQLQWKHQFEFAGFYAAKQKGYYADVGLDVSFKEYKNGVDIVNDVLSKKSTYGTSYSDIVIDYLQGKPIVLVANFFKHSPLVIVTQPDITLPSELKNKRVMGVEKSLKSAAFLMMFKDFDMDLNSFTNVPPSFTTKEFMDKKVDAMVAYTTNELYTLNRAGIKYNVLNPSSYGTEYYDDNLFTSRDELINHPKRVKNFRDASIKGWTYALSHKEEIVNLILKKYNTQHKSYDALMFEARQIQNMMNPALFKIGSVSVRRLRIMAEDFIEMNLLPKNVSLDFSDFVYKQRYYNTDLTKEEKNYLEKKGVIRMCVDPDWMPFEAIQNKKHIGISADYFKLLRKNSHMDIKLYPTKSWQESISAAKSRKCDIFSLASKTKNRLKYMDFTTPYLKLPIVLATRIDRPYTYNFYALKDKKIGVIKGYAIGEILHAKYPQMRLVEFKNIHEALKKVESGDIYGYVDNLMTIAYTIQRDFTNQMKISSRVNEEVLLAIGTRNDELLLHSIFEKLIHTVSEKQKQKILNSWISVKEVKETNYNLLFKILGFIIVLGIIFLYRYYILKKYNKKLEKLSTTDVLTGLNNRLKIDTTLQNQHNLFLRYKTPCSIMIVDIDYFKNINDTYGHQVGDTVLKEIANIFISSVRTTDIVGRWGGEEFLIICPNTNMEELKILAQNIRKKVVSHKFSKINQNISISIGLSTFQINKTITTIVKEADSALYRAKENGRNQVCY